MRVHVDVLGWLFVLAGATAALTGVALGCLAVGTALTVSRQSPAASSWAHPLVVVFVAVAFVLILGGGAMAAIGRALGRRRPGARPLALAAGVVNIGFLPFGTALGIYTFWVLVNDEARRQFGREQRDV
jgi:hypothetical protein